MLDVGGKPLLICFVSIVLLGSITCYKIPAAKSEAKDAVRCVREILTKYYNEGREVTYVDMRETDDDILLEIHRSLHVSIVSRTAILSLSSPNKAYIINVKKTTYFQTFFKSLTKEAQWNPNAKFIVLVDSDENELKYFFETFLVFHVINVVIVHGSHDPALYTYNPFENNGCGRKFDRIINYGKCNSLIVTNLFPNKMITGIRNCTFNVAAPHWPPYSIDPSTKISKLPGIEQFVFQIISEIEHFHTNYTYSNDAENFTVINAEMSAVGPLGLLQKNTADVILGGMLLIKKRADLFDYIYSHLAYEDEIKILVKNAGTVQPWKNVYLEFRPAVWILLIVSFMVYFLLLILILRGYDKSFVLLMMWGSLLLHGRSIRSSASAAKYAIIMWVWFAYLINSYYQSNLVSLSTHPAKDYQVSCEQDLERYHLEPCVSRVIQTILWSETEKPLQNTTYDCHTLLRSIRTVSERDNLYTIALYSLYTYNRYNFYDNYGTSFLYEFPTMNKIVYAIYFYKGFPLQHKFHGHALRLRESGLIDKITGDLYYEKRIRQYYHYEQPRFKVELPWFIYLFGVGISALTLVLEIATNKKEANLLINVLTTEEISTD